MRHIQRASRLPPLQPNSSAAFAFRKAYRCAVAYREKKIRRKSLIFCCIPHFRGYYEAVLFGRFFHIPVQEVKDNRWNGTGRRRRRGVGGEVHTEPAI
ncbi:MAG: hypothetical protein V1878_02400 [bacterium]